MRRDTEEPGKILPASRMLSPRQHIVNLVEILFRAGVSQVVLSPGSRNAPLIEAFYARFADRCISIVDERSAAFFGLGFAQASQQLVVLVCTSGSAALNYAPALAEAYYQHIPLLAITADRPAGWIDQLDNQTLRQCDLYRNFIKASFLVPAEVHSEDDLWFAHRLVNEAIHTAMSLPKGPVHLNIPIPEPLYTPLPPVSDAPPLIERFPPTFALALPASRMIEWQRAENILIVHGQDIPQSGICRPLSQLAANDPRVTVVAENLANARDPAFIDTPQILFTWQQIAALPPPDLLVYAGGQVVSKALKRYLRTALIPHCWRVGVERGLIDTYQSNTAVVPLPAASVYEALSLPTHSQDTPLQVTGWRELFQEARRQRDVSLSRLPFSDCLAMHNLLEALPAGVVLQLGNSSVVRLAQLFATPPDVEIFSNRGLSGIDGSVSTAVGSAAATKKLTICIVGDMGFIYDSNALWNRALPDHLRIVVLNNGGGGIFDLLESRLSEEAHENFVYAHHPVDMKKLTEAFGLRHFIADDEASLQELLPAFYSSDGEAAVLEIRTDRTSNRAAYFALTGRDSHRP